MKPLHSNSLILVWRVAEYEARNLKASMIEPSHLLLGLCKIVDVDLPALVAKDIADRDEILEELLREVRRLRNIFRAAGLNARAFRRRLRAKGGGNRFTLSEARRLRRSKNAKQVFVDAEHFAAIANSPVYPTHLLYAALLTDDESRDAIMNELAIDKNRLRQVAKREALPHHNAEFLQPDKDRTNWN